jgi:hypothetical protein
VVGLDGNQARPLERQAEQEWRATMAWRGAIAATALNIVGMPVDLVVARGIPEVPTWPAFASMTVGALLFVVLLVCKKRPSVALGNTVFLLNTLAIIVALWFINRGFAASGRPWVPFQEDKLGMVTVAMLAPELWVGIVSIAGYAAASFLEFALFGDLLRSHIALGEPWATIAIGTFSMFLLVYRVRRHALERDIARAHAQVEVTGQLAVVLLAVRDLANTPLQTIAFAAAAARERHSDLGPLMDRVDRSLAKLRLLDRRLRVHDSAVRWTRREESLDAGRVALGPKRPR